MMTARVAWAFEDRQYACQLIFRTWQTALVLMLLLKLMMFRGCIWLFPWKFLCLEVFTENFFIRKVYFTMFGVYISFRRM